MALQKRILSNSVCQLTVLILFTLVILISGLKTLPTTDRDEAHFAQATRQMLQTGNYFQIRFQERTRFQKPPGINWLQAISVSLFSDHSDSPIWTYRLPSLLCGLLSLLLLYYFSKRYWGNKIAALASIFLASSFMFVVEGHLAVIDSALLFSVILMQGSFLVIYMNDQENQTISMFWSVCFWVSMALGFLLKGVTPLVGFLTLGMLLIVDRWYFRVQSNWLKQLHFVWGLLLFIGLTLLWVIPVNRDEHSNYLLQLFYQDLLPKLISGHESHGRPPLFHLITLPLTFWPGSIFLYHAVRYAWTYRQQRLVVFLLAWLIPVWLFFEIMPTKLPQYVLPTFPVIALFLALGIREWEGKYLPNYLKFLCYIWFVITSLLAIACLALPYVLLHTIDWLQFILVFLIIFIAAGVVYLIRRGFCLYASIGTLLLALFIYPLLLSGVLPKLQPIWITQSIVQKISKNRLTPQYPLLVVGYNEPSLVFELDTNLVKFTDAHSAFENGIQYKKQLLLVGSDAWIVAPESRQEFVILEKISGFNYNRGRWIELYLMRHKRDS